MIDWKYPLRTVTGHWPVRRIHVLNKVGYCKNVVVTTLPCGTEIVSCYPEDGGGYLENTPDPMRVTQWVLFFLDAGTWRPHKVYDSYDAAKAAFLTFKPGLAALAPATFGV